MTELRGGIESGVWGLVSEAVEPSRSPGAMEAFFPGSLRDLVFFFSEDGGPLTDNVVFISVQQFFARLAGTGQAKPDCLR